MEALYRIGDDMAFGNVPSGNTVVWVEITRNAFGEWVESVYDSGGGFTNMVHGQEWDTAHHPIVETPGDGRILMGYAPALPKFSVCQGLEGQGNELVDVSGSNLDYWRLLVDRWTPEHDLRICEQDVVWRPDVTEAFESCPEPWCVFPYDDHSPEDAEAWANMLGCTRFRKELIAAVPEAVSGVREPMRDWHYVCDGIGRALRDAGYKHHWHLPPVHHDHG